MIAIVEPPSAVEDAVEARPNTLAQLALEGPLVMLVARCLICVLSFFVLSSQLLDSIASFRTTASIV